MENQLRALFSSTAKQLFPDVTLPDFVVEHPENESHGDYATNLPLVLARLVGKSPREVADLLVGTLPLLPEVDSWQIAGPGFINVTLKATFFVTELERVLAKKDAYGRVGDKKGERVVFEYGQPNTHKIPHVGHLYSYCYGESCSRLLEATGYDVIRANYQGDVGPHVAKCLWAYLKNNQPDPEGLTDRANYLQQCYQQGSQAYDDDDQAKAEIDTLNKQIYDKDPVIIPVWEKTRQWSLDAYRPFESRLGIHYDRFFLESETYEPGMTFVKQHVGTLFEEDHGAIVFRGEKYGLHTRVFINSQGNPTYEAKDIGLVTKKWQEFKFDKAIVEVGNDQLEYWRVVRQAIELVFPELKGKISTLHHGMINLTTGKMSSRTGNIVSAFSLVDMVKAKLEQTTLAERDYTSEQKSHIAEVVSVGAIKYSFLKSSPGKDITFDLEASIASEGNSGPYLQYMYARCQSLLKKGQMESPVFPADWQLTTEEEKAIARWIVRYPDIVTQAAGDFAPHTLAHFLFELAQRFSLFYDRHSILKDNPELMAGRLALVAVVGQVVKNGLYLLGIEVSDRI